MVDRFIAQYINFLNGNDIDTSFKISASKVIKLHDASSQLIRYEHFLIDISECISFKNIKEFYTLIYVHYNYKKFVNLMIDNYNDYIVDNFDDIEKEQYKYILMYFDDTLKARLDLDDFSLIDILDNIETVLKFKLANYYPDKYDLIFTQKVDIQIAKYNVSNNLLIYLIHKGYIDSDFLYINVAKDNIKYLDREHVFFALTSDI